MDDIGISDPGLYHGSDTEYCGECLIEAGCTCFTPNASTCTAGFLSADAHTRA
jgi:hypothetical protein